MLSLMKLSVFKTLLLCLFVFGCTPKENKTIITVNGPVIPGDMGKTLHHEHLLVDMGGADSTGYHRWDKDSVIAKVLPQLIGIKNLGYKTLVDCSPAFLGRDPELLKKLSEESGIQILTNTGLYSAYRGNYLPKYAFTETAEQLATRWIDEAENGIEGTGIYPGFIKIAVERAPLKEINKKVVEAACITHKATGLTIMSHTGLAVPAFQQLEILKNYGISPSAFIWTHANNEKDHTKQIEAARMGAWIAFDKFVPKDTEEYVAFAQLMKDNGLLNKLMFSHDALCYQVGKPKGGKGKGLGLIERHLVPALKDAGFNEEDIDQIFVKNPANAFAIGVRLTN